MNPFLARTVTVIAVAALLAVMPAQMAYAIIYRTITIDHYKFYVASDSWLQHVEGLRPYVSKAYNAAYKVLGGRGAQGFIDVYPVSEQGSIENGHAVTDPNRHEIFLNVLKLEGKPYSQWGATLAHETAHVMLGTYVQEWNWRRVNFLDTYYSFLDESLAFYAESCVYEDGWRLSGQELKTLIPQELTQGQRALSRIQNYYAPGLFTWYGSSFYYYSQGQLTSDLRTMNPIPAGMSSATYNQIISGAQWRYLRVIQLQLIAQGYFLANYGGGNGALLNTIMALRIWGNYPNQYLQATYPTSRSYFEKAFDKGYGKYADAGLVFIRPPDGRLLNLYYYTSPKYPGGPYLGPYYRKPNTGQVYGYYLNAYFAGDQRFIFMNGRPDMDYFTSFLIGQFAAWGW